MKSDDVWIPGEHRLQSDSSSSSVPAHHLIIKDGELVQTHELTAFLRKFRSRAGILKDLLAILQTTLSRYGVPLVPLCDARGGSSHECWAGGVLNAGLPGIHVRTMEAH